MNISLLLIIFLILIALIANLVNQKNLPFSLRLYAILLFFTLIVESTAFYLLQRHIKTTFLYHYYLPFNYCMLCLIYFLTFEEEKIRKLLIFSIPVFLILHVYLSLYIQKPDKMNSYAFMIMSFVVVTCSLGYFYRIIMKMEKYNVLASPHFWVNTGNLFFYAGSFFVMGLINYLVGKNIDLARKIFIIIYLLNYVLYPMYTIGFLIDKIWKPKSS